MSWWKKTNDADDPILRMCPVCGKHKFTEAFQKCPVCNWENDYVQENNPRWINGANELSLDEARRAYAEGQEIH